MTAGWAANAFNGSARHHWPETSRIGSTAPRQWLNRADTRKTPASEDARQGHAVMPATRPCPRRPHLGARPLRDHQGNTPSEGERRHEDRRRRTLAPPHPRVEAGVAFLLPVAANSRSGGQSCTPASTPRSRPARKCSRPMPAHAMLRERAQQAHRPHQDHGHVQRPVLVIPAKHKEDHHRPQHERLNGFCRSHGTARILRDCFWQVS